MEDRLLTYLQTEHKFSSLDAKRIIYALKAIFSEVSKVLIIMAIALPLGYVGQAAVITVVLLSIRCYSGGLHFSHYISCLGFTLFFYAAVILLARQPMPNAGIALGLVISLGIFALIGPITSPMRPPLTAAEFNKYLRHVILLLLLYSLLLILWKTLPYRNIIFWVIVLQILQLLCAKIAQKGDQHEETV